MVTGTTQPFVFVASEILPPRDAGGRTATRLAVAHQERATEVARQHGGLIHVRVGLGCVARFDDADQALLAASALLRHDKSRGRSRPRSVRAALHRGPMKPEGAALADPSVAFTRTLLSHAGPGEIVLSVDLFDHLQDPSLQTTPIPSDESVGILGGLPAAHRLLSRPAPPTNIPGHTTLSGWRLGGAVALAIAAAVCTLVVALVAG